ncbi:MAG TPA: HPr family phosphocarrier protein [Thermoanaerobacterales bacterium]|nr:HPr family phosphocarrier protein [Thermoanaerobacterales bacterium]
MVEKSFVIKNETGLHARPASVFVKEANKYKSNISIFKDNKESNAKSIISLLSLGAVKGTLIKIVANGEDEDDAIDGLVKLLESFKD